MIGCSIRGGAKPRLLHGAATAVDMLRVLLEKFVYNKLRVLHDLGRPRLFPPWPLTEPAPARAGRDMAPSCKPHAHARRLFDGRRSRARAAWRAAA